MQGGDDDGDDAEGTQPVFVCTRAVNSKATKASPYHPLQAPEMDDDDDDDDAGTGAGAFVADAESSDDGGDDGEFRVVRAPLRGS